MLHFNVRSNSKGFTLIEVLVVMIMIGILSAIAAPSFLGLLNRNRVNNAAIRLKSALVEAQANTTRIGRYCEFIINSTTENPITLVDTTRDTVIISGVSTPDQLTPRCWRTGEQRVGERSFGDPQSPGTNSTFAINTQATPFSPSNFITVRFDFKGRVTTPDSATQNIVVSGPGTSYQRCVNISYPLGIVRMGTYESNTCKIDP